MSLFLSAKPFIKWAGGKTQLIRDIQKSLPKNLNKKFTYIEPFVGSGAILFWMLNNFENIDKAVINDINKDLTDTYKTIAINYKELVEVLKSWEQEFHYLEGKEELKKDYFNQKRTIFNQRISGKVEQSALFIFLNKTCFNGLYRVNRKNEYNVPMGSYKKPLICDEENLRLVNKVLQKVEILNGDFSQTISYAEENTFFYLDPPYKPLSKTSNFNTYAKEIFDDNEQIRLRNFCKELDNLGYSWILSNSDMKNLDFDNDFFDDLYSDFNIKRVSARRSINSKSEKRGKLTELLITNNNYKII